MRFSNVWLQRASISLFSGLLWVGCASAPRGPDLGSLYNRNAQFHEVTRNPIILIPGILGSKLKDSESGRPVWGTLRGDYADPSTPLGARLMALPMREGDDLTALTDQVYPDGILDRVKMRVLGIPIEVKAYFSILDALGIGGYRNEGGDIGSIDYGPSHFTCFEFPYDWRADIPQTAAQLDEFIQEKREYVQSEYAKQFGVEDYDVKFDIVAHSMGGLLLRYYLRYGTEDLPEDGSAPEVTWAGSEYVERAVLVAPPNAGSVESFDYLISGRDFGPTIHSYAPAILGTMPATYQLMPRPRHAAMVDAASPGSPVDFMDPKLWEEMEWGLADPNQDGVLQWLLPDVPSASARHRIALDHQAKNLKRARHFMTAMDQPATPPPGLHLYLMAGDAIETASQVELDRGQHRIRTVRAGAGDGVVLRTSALMDERSDANWEPKLVSPIRWSQVYFLFSEHLHITMDPAFTDNLLYLLLEHRD
jgi:lecithin:cholesterol acyltransferase